MKLFKDRSLIKLITLTLGIQLTVLAVIWFSGHSFTIWGDQTEEVIQLYTHFYRTFKGGDITLWQPYVGLGASTSVHFYTVFTALSSWLFLLLPNESLIPVFLPFINVIRSVFILILAYYYFKLLFGNVTFGGKIGALLLAFNSFSLFFAHFPYFADFMLIVVLLLIGSERILNHKSPALFIIGVFLSSTSNLYSIYMNCWFLLIYFTFRLFMIEHKLTVKKYFSTFIKVFCYLLVGIGLSSFIFIPNVNSVLINNRLGGGAFHIFPTLKDIFARFSMLISPITSDFDYNCYINALAGGMNSPIPYLYTSILFVFTFVLLIQYKQKYRKVFLITLSSIFILSFFPILNYVFNGFNNIRWAYFFTVIAIIVISYLLNESWEKTAINTAIITSLVYVIIIFGISYAFNLHSQRNAMNMLVNTIVMLGLIILFGICLIRKQPSLFIAVLSFELTYSFMFRYVTLAGFETENKYEYQQIMYAINENDGVDFIKSIDTSDDYYRIDVQKNNFTNYNDAIMNQYSGFDSYLSVSNFYINNYIYRHFSPDHFINSDGTKTLAKQLAGMRYAINYGKELIGDDLTLLKSSHYNAYKVTNPINFGYALNDTLNSNFAHSLPSFYQDYLSQYYIITNSSPNKTIESSYTLENYFINSNNNYLSLEGKNAKYMVIDYSLSNPLSNVTLEFYDNEGKSMSYHDVSEYAYTVLPIPSNAHGVYIYCTNQNNPNEYIDATAFLLDNYTLDSSKFIAQFSNHSMATDRITGSITLPIASYVQTIVAYDPNWKVYDNGSEIDTFISNDGFVGFSLPAGNHNIVLHYQPNIITPTLITTLSAVAFVYIMHHFKKRPNGIIH